MRGFRLALVLFLAALAGLAALAACTSGFDPQSKIDSVRMFAVRADKPYAKPGDDVNLEVLMTDGRKTKPLPLKLYWIPVVCINPQDDLYDLCFVVQDDGGTGGTRLIPTGPLADAGADGGLSLGGGSPFAEIPQGVDLGPFLPQGTTFGFHIPEDIIQPRQGIDPYGLAIVFNIACAGRVEIVPRDPNGGPQQVPVSCTDENGVALTPNDYVIGISRVYSYTTRTNANPIIDAFTVSGVTVDPKVGITVDKCVGATKRANCPEIDMDVHVTDDSWELDPTNGSSLHEQIWVDYYSDIGDFDAEARLLFDPQQGRIPDAKNKYRAPYDPAEGTLWAVVHDDRGGAAWTVLPLHVK